MTVASARSDAVVPALGRRKTEAATGLLHATLFFAILSSPIVFIEPAPYEFLMGALALVCVAAGVRMPRLTVPLLVLLILWNIGGALSLLNVPSKERAVMFVATSFYLSGTAILFACLFAEDSVRRLTVMRKAYIAAALIAATVGIAAYFNLFPGAEQLTMAGRAKSTFKDPNVYGPFLILPLLLLFESSLREGIRVGNAVAASVLVMALLLAFSRGAWAHAAVSAAIMMGLMFLAARSVRLRGRILLIGIALIGAIAALIVVLISFEAVGGLFRERAALIQYYDAGESGRFGNQLRSLPLLLDHPNGFGPLEFRTFFKEDPHNVYLNAFASYGWLGGIAYILLILMTLAVGFQQVLFRTPWQPFFIPVYATFVGVVLEGAIVDTDHWRHFFLLLGTVWGLAAANVSFLRRASIPQRALVIQAPTPAPAPRRYALSRVSLANPQRRDFPSGRPRPIS